VTPRPTRPEKARPEKGRETVRVIHVLTLATDDGAYGGPLTVAVGQAAELRARGHRVDVVAGRLTGAKRVDGPDGVAVRTFRALRLAPSPSVAWLFSPGLLGWLVRSVRGADVVHVHTGRDLVGLTAIAVARVLRRPVVVQTHGMLSEKRDPLARAVDAVLTRPLLGTADRHLVLTDLDEHAVRALGASASVQRIPNGVAGTPDAEHDEPAVPDVLYCARLHRRKRAGAFVEMAALLAGRFPGVRFSIVGPDGGELAAVRRAIERHGLAGTVHYEGPLPGTAVLARMRRSTVYVLPSVEEPFPMSLLEALSVGLPSVCTFDTGISDALAAERAAIVTDGSPRELAAAVAGLLESSARRDEMAAAGRRVIAERYSVAAMVDVVDRSYREVTSREPAPPVTVPLQRVKGVEGAEVVR
jgi:glycosyltransferase involved in cell wall biosynthesis